MANIEDPVKREHRERFELEYFVTTKRNSTLVSKDNLINIKSYLQAERDGRTYGISYNLKRRIHNNKFRLATFPSEIDAVCVLADSGSSNSNKVSWII